VLNEFSCKYFMWSSSFVYNVPKLWILAIHKVVPQYYCGIYNVSYIVIILNVRTQYQVLEQMTFTFTVTTFVHFSKLAIHKVVP
jgi:hypothetical protein